MFRTGMSSLNTFVLARSMQTKILRPWKSHRLLNVVGSTPSLTNAQQIPMNNAAAQTQQPKTQNNLINNKPARRPLRPLRAAISIKPAALAQLRFLSKSPNPQLIRIGVRNKGCSGLVYHLEYVSKPAKFDEAVVQDDVKVLVDPKALFSVIGSDMDYIDDGITAKFVFNNPNSKGSCGCGESFMV